jgi:hypothetical protein
MVPYVMLSQILPISFAVSLFIIQLHLANLGASPNPRVPEPKTSEPAKPKKTYNKSNLTLQTIMLNVTLIAMPRLRFHAVFIPMVLFTRLILAMPFTGRIDLRDEQVVPSISISGGFFMANFYMLRKVVGWRDIYAVLNVGGEAVKTFAWDAQLSALVYAALGWGGGV